MPDVMTNIIPRIGGPAIIQIDLVKKLDQNPVFENLGITRDGVEIEFQSFFDEIKSDFSGGEAGGLFNDMQYLGTQAIIRAELVKFDAQVLTKLWHGLEPNQEDPSLLPPLGAPVVANDLHFWLAIYLPNHHTLFPGFNRPRIVFPKTYVQEPPRFNVGTKYTTVNIAFRAVPIIYQPANLVGKLWLIQETQT